MARLSVQLLGGFAAQLDSGQPLSLTKKAQALVAYLAMPTGRPHSRDKLASLLWGHTGDEQARQSLRQTLVAVRRALPTSKPPILVADGDVLTLAPAAVEVDAQQFERLAADDRTESLEEAMALYRGDLLGGVRVTEEPFEDWLRAERARLHERAVHVLTRLLDLQSQVADTDRAVHTATRLLAIDPLGEPAHRALMRLYARQGRRGEALRQYQACVNVLQRELRAEPEAETKHLYRELLQRVTPRSRPPDAFSREGARVSGRASFLPTREGQLVGREVELEWMRQAWAASRGGQGQVVVIAGEAGIGKSRLMAELAAEAAGQGGRVLLGRCYESEQILPFGPWVDALRTGGVAGNEELLARLGPAWRAELGRLLPDVAMSGGPSPTDDRLRLFESVIHVVEQLGAPHPTVLALEDLHWADEMSLRLLAFVARRIRSVPVLLVVTVREEEPLSGDVLRLTGDELSREPHCLSLTLSPLSPADTASLVRTLAGPEHGDSAVSDRAEQVWAISEGNPFVAVEAMRALQEGEVARGPGAPLSLPTRIREMIARRLGRLSAQGQELAAVAAVVGQPFEFALVQRASGMAEREAAQGVEELVRRRIIHGIGEHFDFTHDRIRTVAYDGIGPPRRRLVHEAVGRSLEEIHIGDLSPHLTALGTHHAEAQAWPKAARYLWDAGRQAVARSAHREAVTCFERALVALRRLPESRANREQTVDLLFDLRHSLLPLAAIPRMRTCVEEAERLATSLGDQRRLGWALSHRTRNCMALTEYDDAIAAGERAIWASHASGDDGIAMATSYYLGGIYHALGDYRRAVDCHRPNFAPLDSERAHQRFGLPYRPAVVSRSYGAGSLAAIGDFTEALTRAHEALTLAEADDLKVEVILASSMLGGVYLTRGHLAPASAALDRALALCQDGEFPIWFSAMAPAAGLAHALAGRTDEALRLLDAAANMLGDCRSMEYVWVSIPLAEAYLRAGRRPAAVPFIARAVELGRSARERGRKAHAHYLAAEIASDHGSLAVGETAEEYRQALALADQLGMRPLVARCHLGLGQLHRRTGDRARAREHLATASAMLRAMDMRFWLDQAAVERHALA